jgi:hypothetical protein
MPRGVECKAGRTYPAGKRFHSFHCGTKSKQSCITDVKSFPGSRSMIPLLQVPSGGVWAVGSLPSGGVLAVGSLPCSRGAASAVHASASIACRV